LIGSEQSLSNRDLLVCVGDELRPAQDTHVRLLAVAARVPAVSAMPGLRVGSGLATTTAATDLVSGWV
jgi:hypothetical protein